MKRTIRNTKLCTVTCKHQDQRVPCGVCAHAVRLV